VVEINNLFTNEFRNLYLDHVNELQFTVDPSNSALSSIRASVDRGG
jgi:hypothetical protein